MSAEDFASFRQTSVSYLGDIVSSGKFVEVLKAPPEPASPALFRVLNIGRFLVFPLWKLLDLAVLSAISQNGK